ncbi:hypothetical protein BOTBODRAFT_243388 [Botryobasidium botryosum FD-172 SS1]|uniref:Uncharacterized protein n=1 Tax=Botryobasidium botryosum (strain FD-172 SS1) TaxID=930990 RepID=A0A067LWR1_BOTB1|nr:hypothetical protein BOTBODRAFT_243388 [Botryobasidium botryosum FD-172 SS1]
MRNSNVPSSVKAGYPRNSTRTSSNRSLASVGSQSSGSFRGSSMAGVGYTFGVREHSQHADAHRPITPERFYSLSTSMAFTSNTDQHGGAAAQTSFPTTPLMSTVLDDDLMMQSFTPQQAKRASLALGEALKELGRAHGKEDPDIEAEDTVLTPRSPLTTTRTMPGSFTPSSFSNPAARMTTVESWVEDDDRETKYYSTRGSTASTSLSVYRFGNTSPPPASESRIPGYIPGMHRPITPRDFDSDDQQSHSQSNSTTPRALSPPIPLHQYSPPAQVPERPLLPSSILTHSRRGSNASTRPMMSARSSSPTSPTSSTPRASRVHHPAEERSRGDTPTHDVSLPAISPTHSSSLMDRRRPSSPLANLSFQAIAASRSEAAAALPIPVVSSPLSASDQPQQRQRHLSTDEKASTLGRAGEHSRSNSSISRAERPVLSNIPRPARSKSPSKSPISPSKLPESPVLDNARNGAGQSVQSFLNFSGGAESEQKEVNGHRYRGSNVSGKSSIYTPPRATTRSPTSMRSSMSPTKSPAPSGKVLTPGRASTPAQPISPARSPTPGRSTTPVRAPGRHHQQASISSSLNDFDQQDARSISNGISNGKTSPKPPSHFSTFSSGTHRNPLILSPLLNSSRSSIVSAGSSYHSWEGEEAKGDILVEYDSLALAWDEVREKPRTSGDPREQILLPSPQSKQEDYFSVLPGITKNDIASIQTRLVNAALAKRAAPSLPRAHSPHNKRRPSMVSTRSYGQDIEYSNIPMRVITPPTPLPISEHRRTSSQASENALKANALLQSVMDSIPAPPSPGVAAPTAPVRPPTEQTNSESLKALNEALFGREDVNLPSRAPTSHPLHQLCQRALIRHPKNQRPA